MTTPPTLNTQVIGQAESALGAILKSVLAETGATFEQWLVLNVTAGSGAVIDRDTVVARIASARKIDGSVVLAAIAQLITAGLLEPIPGSQTQVRLADAGRALYHQIRGPIDQITGQLFDLPAEDLAAAGRVLAIVTARANEQLSRLASS